MKFSRPFAALGLAVVLAVTGCSSEESAPTATTTPASATPDVPKASEIPPAPSQAARVGSCHRLTRKQAVAPTPGGSPTACRRPHTAQTFARGHLQLLSEGHVIGVDSPVAADQASAACTAKLARFVGATDQDLRLTMLKALWFTPSLVDSDSGADWYQCDVIAISDDRLVRLPRGSLQGALKDSIPPALAMCATAAPGTTGFRRVTCDRRHTWRAVSSVELPGRTPPRTPEVLEAECKSRAKAAAEDPLNFTWSQELPTADQWAAGQRHGLCWVPA